MIYSDMNVLGNVDADGFTINDIPVGTSSDSYWSQNGSDIFYNLGNVGIGTITPAEPLDVQGNIHASGTITSGSSITIDGTADRITSSSGTIDFDDENIVTTGKATIGPGHTNTGPNAFVAGLGNIATGDLATVSGGAGNTANGARSSIGGGEINFAESTWVTVGGGFGDTASGGAATIAGGYDNAARKWCATVGGGYSNDASGSYSIVGGGLSNRASGDWSAVTGGNGNQARARESAIGGGWNNATDGQWSNISGGYASTAAGDFSHIGGGWHNSVQGEYSAILGGYADTIGASADYSYLFGIGSRLDDDSTFMVDMPHIFLQGEIFQANSAGDTTCNMKWGSNGAGIITTIGPNSNNTRLTSLVDYPNNGVVAVRDANSQYSAYMYVFPEDNFGYVHTNGPNGNGNTMLTCVVGDPNRGAVGIIDSLDEQIGWFLVNEYSAGTVGLLGQNYYYNVYIGIPGPPNDDPNNGMIGVCDNDGILQAWMYVDTSGQGIVWGDQVGIKADNPKQPGTDVWYCALEGPEAAAYARGTGHLVNGRADVTLPDHFTSVASSQGITVQIIPLSGESKGLAVVEKSTDRFAVRELNNGSGTYDFDFMVTAVRKGHEDYQVIRPAMKTQPAELGAAPDGSEIQLKQRFR